MEPDARHHHQTARSDPRPRRRPLDRPAFPCHGQDLGERQDGRTRREPARTTPAPPPSGASSVPVACRVPRCGRRPSRSGRRGPVPSEPIAHGGDRSLVARDRVGTEDHRVVVVELEPLALADRHLGERGPRLALRPVHTIRVCSGSSSSRSSMSRSAQSGIRRMPTSGPA